MGYVESPEMAISNGKKKKIEAAFWGSQGQPAWLVEMGDPRSIFLRTGREERSPAAAPQMGSRAGLLLVGPAQPPNCSPLGPW